MKIKPILFVIAILGTVSALKAQTLKVAYINTQRPHLCHAGSEGSQ